MTKNYVAFIKELKQSIIQSRYIANRLANKEQLLLNYRTGKNISEKIAMEKWGAKILDKIAEDLQVQLPGLKGFSASNLKKMRIFAEAYSPILQIGSAASNQLKSGGLAGTLAISSTLSNQIGTEQFTEAFYGVSFSHHFTIITKTKDWNERLFYLQSAASNYWSLSVLEHHITSDYYKHAGKLPNNFTKTLSEDLKPSALQVFRDEYLFDFVTMDESEDERVFEGQIVTNIKNTIMALGKGFAFMGNQYRLEVDGQEFFIDLLFYNRLLQCMVVFELKRGRFKPEYAGQLSFYLSVLDEKVKLTHENASIGIILCKEKSNTVVEFAFKNINSALGAATFRTSKEVPNEMKGILPSAKELSKIL